jgi:hypothetical protein
MSSDVCAVCSKPECAYPASQEPDGFMLKRGPGVDVECIGRGFIVSTPPELPSPSRWPYFVLWLLAAFASAVFVAVFFGGCGTLDAFAAAHPDVVQKAETAVELAQCVDTAVVKYRKAEVASTAAAVTTLPPPTPEGTQ